MISVHSESRVLYLHCTVKHRKRLNGEENEKRVKKSRDICVREKRVDNVALKSEGGVKYCSTSFNGPNVNY